VKFYFTKRSLQISKFAHKSLGSPISPSPLCFSSLWHLFHSTAGASSGGFPCLPLSTCLGRHGSERAAQALGERSAGRLGAAPGGRRRVWAAAACWPGVQGWSPQVELRRGGLAWTSTGTARPRAWGTWWWPSARRGGRSGAGGADRVRRGPRSHAARVCAVLAAQEQSVRLAVL
jgi:hypothetical protein